jgi:hypothetical protein
LSFCPLFFLQPVCIKDCSDLARGQKGDKKSKRGQKRKGATEMNKYNFNVDALNFDIDEMVEQIEKEYGRMIVRIPKFYKVNRLQYEFTAIFSDFTILEAELLVIPKVSHEGIHAEIHVQGVYL